MKILFYNWCQFDDPHMAGGGVSLYLRNIIRDLARRDDIEVYFLSAGGEYGLRRRKPLILPTDNAFAQDGVKTFKMVNSPIKAPAHDAFHAIGKWLRDSTSTTMIKGFLKEHGPFDALHIHNLEGVSANVLSLDKDENLARIFYTFHNYMPVCPQIELLYQGKTLCETNFNGTRCVSCMGHKNRMEDLISFQRVSSWLSGRGLAGTPLGNFVFGTFAGAKQIGLAFRYLAMDTVHGFRTNWSAWRQKPTEPVVRDHAIALDPSRDRPREHAIKASRKPGVLYDQWRKANGAALKANVDGIFAVSDLARDTALRFLPAGTQVTSLPLPMDFNISPEDRQARRAQRQQGSDITLSFVGYGIPSKGLGFLIDALGRIDDDFYRHNVHLKIVARLHDTDQLTHLDRVFKSVTVVPGYKRSQLAALAQTIDLNIVPSIWWETFNQVTVELGLLGVPSLLSDRVGAKQVLSDPENFVFKAEDHTDFRAKLDRLVKDKSLRDSFFDKELKIPGMGEHVDTLLKHYTGAMDHDHHGETIAPK